MTDTTTVDPDALLAEIMLTPEGKADPYPRYAAIREHSAGVPHDLGLRRRRPVRRLPVGAARPPLRQGRRLEAPWEQYGAHRGRSGTSASASFNRRTELDARPRPAGPHPAAPARRQGVHAEDRRALRPDIVRLTDELLDRFVRRRGRRRDPRARAAAPDRGDLRDARRPRVVLARAPAARPHRDRDPRAQPVARAARGRGRGGPRRSRSSSRA